MQYQYQSSLEETFRLTHQEHHFQRYFFQKREEKLLCIMWNKGAAKCITIDEVRYTFPANHFLCLMVNQSFRLDDATDVVFWQFNREFYCIVEHDKEVSCVGILFYGLSEVQFISLTDKEEQSLDFLTHVFIDEFQTKDTIQGEMLRVLLKRLIIKLTRLIKAQQIEPTHSGENLDIVRQFNLLVENNYRTLHQVQDYAVLLHKSPKALSNLFSTVHAVSPLQVIQDRIVLEARRMLIYSDKNFSEIAYELGFDEPTHFSRFFKKMLGKSPSEFKKEVAYQAN
jgi:AraC family transcriptional regulator, transcriptional activator of pobA